MRVPSVKIALTAVAAASGAGVDWGVLFVPVTPDTARVPRLACPQGSGLGFGVGFTLTGVVVLAAARPALALLVAIAGVALVSALTTVPGALLVAAQSWGLHVGFVAGHFGELSFDEHARWTGALLVVVAVLASVAGAVARTVRTAPSLSARASPVRGRAAGPSPARS
ncbi:MULTISPECIES: hypothetical protein [unclassified Crossiella]|uniref:hypothetical protein n=1 Tax=unclassified Crossiella TaxID=2620835 RepID=UPI001FFE8D9D|nr:MULTISPECIES: hypothetical protein [unclassified Crossiella]MCK2238101.1 hypothetical protein [Crossiella sp. S99.2]MCK2256141.1 hypothetical protein [Crossiella sp. S99.1]